MYDIVYNILFNMYNLIVIQLNNDYRVHATLQTSCTIWTFFLFCCYLFLLMNLVILCTTTTKKFSSAGCRNHTNAANENERVGSTPLDLL